MERLELQPSIQQAGAAANFNSLRVIPAGNGEFLAPESVKWREDRSSGPVQLVRRPDQSTNPVRHYALLPSELIFASAAAINLQRT